MHVQANRSPQDRLAIRKARKTVQSELWKNYLKGATKANKSEFRRTVSESGVRIELSPQAKEMLRDKYIDEVLESGEPLHGISYDDYFSYYKNKHGYIMTDQIQQEYRQALKGDNASLREKEWRTNPDYKIPQRLWDNPLIIADRDAVLDKIRNDEELEEWEKKMTHIFSDAVEGTKIYNDAMLTQRTHRIEKGIMNALSDAGIVLDPDEEIKFEVWGYEMKVMGDFDDEKLHTILDTLSRYAWSMNAVFIDNHPMSKESVVQLEQLQIAENYLKDTGVTVFDISLDEKGNLVGLPGEIDTFIKEYANKPLIMDSSKGWDERDPMVVEAQKMRDAFVSAVKTVSKGKYNYFRSKVGVLSFKNGTLSC